MGGAEVGNAARWDTQTSQHCGGKGDFMRSGSHTLLMQEVMYSFYNTFILHNIFFLSDFEVRLRTTKLKNIDSQVRSG